MSFKNRDYPYRGLKALLIQEEVETIFNKFSVY